MFPLKNQSICDKVKNEQNNPVIPPEVKVGEQKHRNGRGWKHAAGRIS